MKILGAVVDWNDHYDNAPQLVIAVDELPGNEAYSYASKPLTGGRTLYRAEHDGFVRFYLHNPNDEHGYGERSFKLRSHHGEEFTIKGPWSSRSGVVNQHFSPHCTEVMYALDPDHLKVCPPRGIGIYSGVATLDVAIEATAITGNWLVRIVDRSSAEVSYEPVMRRSTPKRIMNGMPDRANYSWEYVYPDIWNIKGSDHLRHAIPTIGYRPGDTLIIAAAYSQGEGQHP